MDRAEEEWRAFWGRHEGLVSLVEAMDEGFWADLSDVLQSVGEHRWTTRGAVVQEWPRMTDAATQTERRATYRESATQTEAPAEPRVSAGHPRGSGSEQPRRTTTPPEMSRGCWNCGELGHRYSSCSRLLTRFCFGCGQRGTTLRSCPRCGSRYRLVGPYSGWRGPRDGPAPQPRVAPWEMPLEEQAYDSDDEEWMWREPKRPREAAQP